MLDRRWFGDLGIAILIALPIASLALPLPSTQQPTSTASASKIAAADRSSGRIGLLG
jgi:hypothetical protein